MTTAPTTESAVSVDGAVPRALCGRKAPVALHTAFEFKSVSPWEPGRFEFIRKLQNANRNQGQVNLMNDVRCDEPVAVKQMPNSWIRRSHPDFVIAHPSEKEMPWQDIGCLQFLNSLDFPYACTLMGVYRDDAHTYVVTSFANEGDLFSWCESGVDPGVEREVLVQPLAKQMMASLQQLHELSIVHGDVSLENILLSRLDDESLRIRVIDFGMASTSRRSFTGITRTRRTENEGKASYQAPELHTDKEHDAYLSDIFALGVTLYAVLTKDYPWLSTRPGGCKCFDYARKHGFRAYLVKRKLRNTNLVVADVVSEPLKQLLEGMLAFDPNQRLTLGEAVWPAWRRSVWDEPWMHEVPGK